MYDKSRNISFLLKQGVIDALNRGSFDDEYIKFVKHLGYLQGHIGNLVDWNLLHPILFYFNNDDYYIKLIDTFKDVYIYINEFKPSYICIQKDGKELAITLNGEMSDELEEYIHQIGIGDMQLNLDELTEQYKIEYYDDSGF